MALCPKCNATLEQMDAVCGVCGYDFPDTMPVADKTAFPFSPMADVSLALGALVAALACVAMVIAGVIAAFAGRFEDAFFVAPIKATLCFAMLVVFLRASKL